MFLLLDAQASSNSFTASMTVRETVWPRRRAASPIIRFVAIDADQHRLSRDRFACTVFLCHRFLLSRIID